MKMLHVVFDFTKSIINNSVPICIYITFKTQKYTVFDLSQKFLIGFLNFRSMLELQSFMQNVLFFSKVACINWVPCG